MSREYLSCSETAKLVRGALKKSFPDTKFTVRSSVYSGGASIRCGWVDGPTEKKVRGVTGVYAGGRFDGMIDMAYSVESYLMPDGSATYGKSPGSQGSMGVEPGYDYKAPAGARLVRFGADFVFCDKEYSVPTYTAAVKKVCEEYGEPMPIVKVSSYGGTPYLDYVYVKNADRDLRDLIGRELQKEPGDE